MTATGVPHATRVTTVDVNPASPGAGLYRLANAARCGSPVRVVIHGEGFAAHDFARATGLATYAISERGSALGIGARMEPPDDVIIWIRHVLEALDGPTSAQLRWGDRLDAVLTRPLTGLPAFLVMVAAFFQLVGVAVGPTADLAATVVGWIRTPIEALDLPRWLAAGLVDGVLAGVETVLGLVPIVALSFAVLTFLEATGLMARAVVVSDKALRRLGLDGAMAASLVLGFGCNVPGVAAAGTLARPRDRIVASALVPYASCSARLTVYVYLAYAIFPGQVGPVVAALYVANAALIAAGGWAASRIAGPCPRVPSLVLPEYAVPSWRALTHPVAREAWGFLARTGPVIVAALTALWLLTAIPVNGGGFAQVPAAESAAGALGEAVAPALEPMGLGDPHLATGLVGAVAAKEVVVGVLAADSAGASADEAILATLERSSRGHPEAAALALMVLLMTSVPCVATVAMQRRTMGVRATSIATALHLFLSWLLAVGVFQIGAAL